MHPLNLESLQKQLQLQRLDGWLLADFRQSNSLMCQLLNVSSSGLLTRRFFYWIPAKGVPCRLVHKIEEHLFENLLGTKMTYASWQQLHQQLKKILAKAKKVAMEYSPDGALPSISKVDAGTVDLIRGFDIQVVSSAALLQACSDPLTQEQIDSHRQAAQLLDQIIQRSWKWIAEHLRAQRTITEYDVQEFILGELAARGLTADHPPICAVNAHCANPHYTPLEQSSSPICQGDFVLIDLWGKLEKPGAIYADLTKVALFGATASKRQDQVFQLVAAARQAALDLIRERMREKKPLQGWEVDRACRQVIEQNGFGEFFIHRTGHDIGQELHGFGAHMDDYETHDTRQIVLGSCFSIEPGIYLPQEFGVRLECDVVVTAQGEVEVTGNPQQEIALVV